jgi:hypothetical protein
MVPPKTVKPANGLAAIVRPADDIAKIVGAV